MTVVSIVVWAGRERKLILEATPSMQGGDGTGNAKVAFIMHSPKLLEKSAVYDVPDFATPPLAPPVPKPPAGPSRDPDGMNRRACAAWRLQCGCVHR